MFVCVCAGVTERQINQAISEGHTSVKALRSALNVAKGCGMCLEDVVEQINDNSQTMPSVEYVDAAY